MNAIEGVCEYWQSRGEIVVNSKLAHACERLAHHIADVQHKQVRGAGLVSNTDVTAVTYMDIENVNAAVMEADIFTDNICCVGETYRLVTDAEKDGKRRFFRFSNVKRTSNVKNGNHKIGKAVPGFAQHWLPEKKIFAPT
eukprot:g1299.t1